MNMNFGATKTPIEVIKEGAFGGPYFRDIYFCVKGKWYRKSQKEFDDLKNIEILTSDIIAQLVMTLASINMALNVEHR